MLPSPDYAMYTNFFKLSQAPFSIAPDPRYLYMSDRHREALAHLLYGAGSDGGIVLLTGEIGAGKTTVCRCFLEQIPATCNVAYIFNPKLTVAELLQSICEEFHVPPARDDAQPASVKEHIDALNRFLLDAHAQGRNSVLIIDEAQNLSADVLEQLRLLTNLETNERKLLQIVLIGQPELRAMLARPELEQLAQRVIARYLLEPLSTAETAAYIRHRLATAGMLHEVPFDAALTKRIHRITQGVPRRINLLCDRALLGAYARGTRVVTRAILAKAAAELFSGREQPPRRWRRATLATAGLLLAAGVVAWSAANGPLRDRLHAELARAGAAVGLMPKQADATAAATAEPAGAATSVAMAPEKTGTTDTTTVAGADTAAPATAPEQTTAVPVAAPPAEDERPAQSIIDSEDEALRQLARLWGATLPEGSACDAAVRAGLRCYRSGEGFAELRQLDRPAVLRLREAGGRIYYALLTGLTDAEATLRAGDAVQTVTPVLLARRFDGEFVTLWRAPPGTGSVVRKGDASPAADWVIAHLAKLYGAKQPAPGLPFGSNTERRLREFQSTQGLFVDGIAGPVTLMQLNRSAGVTEPRLHAAATTAAAAQDPHGE